MRLRLIPQGVGGIILAMALLAGTEASGANIAVQMTGNEQLQFDTNPLLEQQNIQPLFGSVTSPQIDLHDTTPTSHLDAGTRVDVNEFDLKGYSSTDVHSTAGGGLSGEIWQFGLTGGMDYDTTRTSEIGTSGFNVAGIRHTGYNAAPSVTVAITEQDKLLFNGTYQTSSYADRTLYSDYNILNLTPSWQHAFDERNTGVVMFQATRNDTTTGLRSTSDSAILAPGWVTSLTPAWKLSANAGGQRTTWDFSYTPHPSTAADWNYYANAALNYKSPWNDAALTVTRAPSPVSNGGQGEETSFLLSDAYTLNDDINARLDLNYNLYDITHSLTPYNYSYVSANPQVIYHATEYIDLNLSYRFRYQKYSTESLAADSSAVMLGLIYKPSIKTIAW